MDDKKPRGRRPWLDEIRLEDSGQYAYKGSHMKFAGDDDACRVFRLKLGVLSAVMLAFTVAAGCLNVGELDNTYDGLIPYLLEVVLTVACVWAAVRLLLKGTLVRAYIFAQTARRLPVLAVLIALAAAATAVAAAVLLGLRRTIDLPCAVYLLLHAADCAAALVCFKVLRNVKWETV